MAPVAAIVLGTILAFPRDVPVNDTLFAERSFFGSFTNASRLKVDASGRIYVLDENRHSVTVFDEPTGKGKTIGGFGWDATTFDRPTDIVNDGLNYYIADYGNHRILRYDRRFVLLSTLSTRDTSFAPARFGYPLGIALSRQGDLYVLDGENLRIVEFNGRGEFVRAFGALDAGIGRLRTPVELIIAENDKLLVLEQDRILEFDFSGNFIRSYGDNRIRGGKGICLIDGGFLVCENDRLVWLNKDGTTRMITELSTVLSEYPLTPSRGAAMRKGMLLLLTPERLGVFSPEMSSP